MATTEQQLLREAAALLAQGGTSTIGDDGEGVALLPSGKVRATVNGERYELRRPKIREFRAFNERLHEMNAEEQARMAEHAAKAEGNGKPTMFDSTDLLLGWMRSVFEALAAPDKRLPEADDDLPAWFLNPTLPIELVRHWRELPLARSGQR